MAQYQHLALWKQTVSLTVFLEEAVRRFPRYHKYALGTDLRRQIYLVSRLIVLANNASEKRLMLLERLMGEIEALKLYIQMAKEIKAFTNFNDFQQASQMAVSLGKQCGGWQRATVGASKKGVKPRREGVASPNRGATP